MPASVEQMRALLAEKFPGLRTRLEETPNSAVANPHQLPAGALTEIVAPDKISGSATLLHTLLRKAAAAHQIIAVIDGADSLDVSQIDPAILARVLWVRCVSAAEALQAADLILRDTNFSFVVLDLKLNPENELRKIPATSWYRLQRLLEKTSVIAVALTPRPLVKAAQKCFCLPLAGELTF